MCQDPCAFLILLAIGADLGQDGLIITDNRNHLVTHGLRPEQKTVRGRSSRHDPRQHD
jgi:hypothetical protein